MAFLRLFNKVIVRHFRYEWGKLLLSIAGVMIGVAVFIAIRLANTTAFQAFSTSLDAVSGRANLQVISNDGLGFDESVIGRLREVRAVQAAAPVIEQYAQVEDSVELANPGSGAPVLVFGVDVFAENKFRDYQFGEKRGGVGEWERGRGGEEESRRGGEQGTGTGLQFLLQRNAIIITTKLAERQRLRNGDSIRMIVGGRRIPFQVAGIVEPEGTASALGGSFALLDIASAQEVFGRVGRLDRIDLLVPEREREGVKEYLATLLPPGVTVQEPANRNAQTLKMVDSFDLNLTALAFIALFVSMFIIYNTMLTSTLRRRRELGILRAVGATRASIVGLFLGEAVVIGVLGAAAGIPLGIALARVALDQVTQTVTALYILTVAEHLTIDSTTLIVGGLLGVVASFLSALPSAIEASSAHPRETFSVQAFEKKMALSVPRIVAASVLMLVAAGIASLQGRAVMSPMLGFAGAGLVLVGFALLTPIVITTANRIFGPLVKRIFGVEGGLANAYLLQSLGRASTAIAALTTAVAMLIGLSTMVGSFRRTVDYWMRQTITADIYMTLSGNRIASSTQMPMPAEIIRWVDSLPQAASVDAVKRIRMGYGGRTVAVSGARLDPPTTERTLTFMDGEWEEIMAALDTGAAAVSESFALQFEKERGDTIVLSTPTGSRALTIAGTYYDYTSDAATVMMRHAPFARIFADSSLNNVAIFVRDPSRIEEVRGLIERRFGGRYSLLLYSNRSLREEVLDIFDQTFTITYALQFVAIFVAAIGVANTLAALVVERSREIGILKALGATPAQLRKMTLVQAGLIGLASQTLGVAAGLVLSTILIYVINRASFGWTIQMQIDPVTIVTTGVLVLATAFLAGIVPANAAARRRVAEVVRVE